MSTDLFDLSGKTALVSGASRGIGEAIAHVLAAAGAHVVCTSRRVESCERVAAAIRGGASLVHGVQMRNQIDKLSM